MIPVLGWCLISARYISFDRRRPAKLLTDIAQTVAKCQVSVIYFPNGHQNHIRSAADLPKIYLKIAQRSRLDILPVTLTFTEDFFQVDYGVPITAQEVNPETQEALNNSVFEMIMQRNPSETSSLS